MTVLENFKTKQLINGWQFEFNEEHNWFECRGPVNYDDEHDEIPDSNLWKAACELTEKLKRSGLKASPQYSEKGWVEVVIRN